MLWDNEEYSYTRANGLFTLSSSDFFIFLKGSDCLHAGIATHACKDIKIVKDELFSASNTKGNFQFHEKNN